MIAINKEAPNFEADAFYKGDFTKISLSDYKDKWVILFFYPADFTFVCPTELGSLADHYEEIQKLGCEVLSVSPDTKFVHKAWHDHSPTIQKITYPMIADPTGSICRAYGTYIEDEGLSYRGTFIIDPDGKIQSYEMNEDGIGRSIVETIRKLKAAKFVRENPGVGCPMNWDEGKENVQKGVAFVGKY